MRYILRELVALSFVKCACIHVCTICGLCLGAAFGERQKEYSKRV